MRTKAFFKPIIVVAVFIVIASLLTSCRLSRNTQNMPYVHKIDLGDLFIEGYVDKDPVFRGDNLGDSLREYIKENMVYPADALKDSIQGVVIVQFTVEKDGSITDVKALKEVHPLLDAEAVRLFSEMPKWEPGMLRDTLRRVRMLRSVHFRMGERNTKISDPSVSTISHEYVDLGLSVKWCTCNVGATTPLDEGYLYKWNYDAKWYVFDGKAFIKSEGDIANLQRGEDWRTPSNDEMIELLSYCTFTWVDNADSCGFKVTSNIEGFTDRSIFIPVLKAKTPVYEIVNTSDGGHYLNSVDSSYQYTGNYMTNFIKDSNNRPGFLRADAGTFMLFKEAQLFLSEYYIRPVKPLDPVTQQNRVLPQVELRETNIVYGQPGEIDISEFEGLGITTVDEGLQW